MPRTRTGDLPLPTGWDYGLDYDGKMYFIDHNTKKTTWIDPRDSYTKAQTFSDCVGHELPYGWEECYDTKIGLFYVDHGTKNNQIEDPRVQWRNIQQNMLKDYLDSAQTDLSSKQDRLEVKEQRLALAKHEYQELHRSMTDGSPESPAVNALRTFTGKLDPELLKADLVVAKSRIHRIKREMNDMKQEVASTQAGMQTLSQVQDKLTQLGDGYTLEEAQVIMSELLTIEELLKSGQSEKNELLQSLAKLGEDISPLQKELAPAPGYTEPLKTSIASQTDFSSETMPLGAQLAELTKLKLEYDSAKCRLKTLQTDLASLEECLSPTEVQMDRDRLLLIREKEKLLNEYRYAFEHAVSPLHLSDIKDKMADLKHDLSKALENNNKTVQHRLRLQEDRQNLMADLRTTVRTMVKLEGQLRSLSASTLSMSSSSSLGSLSTSSKGSMSSLSFTDIYGREQYASTEQVSVLDLHKRVDKLLKSNHESDRAYAEKLRGLDGSMLSLSPRSSLSSLSPPVDELANLSLSRLDSYSEGILYEEDEYAPTPNNPSMSAAVSDESVAGDSGVYEACPKGASTPDMLQTPQVQIQLRYKKDEGLLCVGVERARNLATLMSDHNCKVCVKVQLFPAGTSTFTCCTHLHTDLEQPYFKDTFSFPVISRRVSSKTIQVNVWAVRDTTDIPDEECVGYAQISLADVCLDTPQVRWYNILNYALLRPDSLNRDDLSSITSTFRYNHNSKEESSDESTIISSQTSTLTRSVGPESVRLHLPTADDFNEVIDSDDDDDDLIQHPPNTEEEEDTENVVDRLLESACDTAVSSDLLEHFTETADKETNTECLFDPLLSSSKGSYPKLCLPQMRHRRPPLIKRSQTFTPDVSDSNYICRLNRSGSDSCVSLCRRMPFKRGSTERRSLRWKSKFSTSLRLPSKATSFSVTKGARTSLDLELDLAAQQLRLTNLKEEIEGLKSLRTQLEVAQDSPEKPAWFSDQDGLPSLLSMATKSKQTKTPEDRRVDRMLRRTSREVHKLRNSKTPRGQPDVISFKEKMAFFLRSNTTLPSLDVDSDGEDVIREETPELATKRPKVFRPESLFDADEQGVQV